jgi:hypothetical protein
VPRQHRRHEPGEGRARVVGQPVELVKVFAPLAFELVQVSDDRR